MIAGTLKTISRAQLSNKQRRGMYEKKKIHRSHNWWMKLGHMRPHETEQKEWNEAFKLSQNIRFGLDSIWNARFPYPGYLPSSMLMLCSWFTWSRSYKKISKGGHIWKANQSRDATRDHTVKCVNETRLSAFLLYWKSDCACNGHAMCGMSVKIGCPADVCPAAVLGWSPRYRHFVFSKTYKYLVRSSMSTSIESWLMCNSSRSIR